VAWVAFQAGSAAYRVVKAAFPVAEVPREADRAVLSVLQARFRRVL
jgi:hypothetical protein